MPVTARKKSRTAESRSKSCVANQFKSRTSAAKTSKSVVACASLGLGRNKAASSMSPVKVSAKRRAKAVATNSSILDAKW